MTLSPRAAGILAVLLASASPVLAQAPKPHPCTDKATWGSTGPDKLTAAEQTEAGLKRGPAGWMCTQRIGSGSVSMTKSVACTPDQLSKTMEGFCEQRYQRVRSEAQQDYAVLKKRFDALGAVPPDLAAVQAFVQFKQKYRFDTAPKAWRGQDPPTQNGLIAYDASADGLVDSLLLLLPAASLKTDARTLERCKAPWHKRAGAAAACAASLEAEAIKRAAMSGGAAVAGNIPGLPTAAPAPAAAAPEARADCNEFLSCAKRWGPRAAVSKCCGLPNAKTCATQTETMCP